MFSNKVNVMTGLNR